MVGLLYDCVANPLGAVRLTFERAVAAASPDAADPVAALNGKDWGAADLFHKFLFEDDGLSQVPIVDSTNLHWIQPNSLVRFRGMVQDMFGSELYVGAYKDGLTWRTNKYADFSSAPIPPTYGTRLWERRLLHCVTVPGLNSWTREPFRSQTLRNMHGNSPSQNGEKRQREGSEQDEGTPSSCSKKQKENEYPCQMSCSENGLVIPDTMQSCNGFDKSDTNSFSCLIKTYDMPESNLKLNDVFEFVGIYTFDPQLDVHEEDSDDLMHDLLEDVSVHLPPNKVPRLHCIICRKLAAQDFLTSTHVNEPLTDMVRGIRESLLCYLTAVLGNDGVAAQFVLLHLLSMLRARVDVITVGKLSLNLTGFTRENASIFGNTLSRAVQNLLPFSQAIPLTVEYLNTATLQPRKNNQTGRLVTGVLQLPQGTHLTIDETHLKAGRLDSSGVENARLLKHLTEWQTVEYDFQYYKLEMAADVQLLILSEGKSNILPADLVLPFQPTSVCSDVNTSLEDLKAWRWYLATLRSLPHNNAPEMEQMLQNDLVAAMQEDRSLGTADLNSWLTMAQLMSASYGETSLSLGHWQMVKELELLRKQRLKQGNGMLRSL